MGLRSAMWTLLSRGAAPEEDDDLREFMTVPMFEGPMLVAELADHGIEAVGTEAYNVATHKVTDMRVMVRRSDLEAAQAVVMGRGRPASTA